MRCLVSLMASRDLDGPAVQDMGMPEEISFPIDSYDEKETVDDLLKDADTLNSVVSCSTVL